MSAGEGPEGGGGEGVAAGGGRGRAPAWLELGVAGVVSAAPLGPDAAGVSADGWRDGGGTTATVAGAGSGRAGSSPLAIAGAGIGSSSGSHRREVPATIATLDVAGW